MQNRNNELIPHLLDIEQSTSRANIGVAEVFHAVHDGCTNGQSNTVVV